MTTNEKTYAIVKSLISSIDMAYADMSLEDAMTNGKFISHDGKRFLAYQYDKRVREYDKKSKTFVVKASCGFTIYGTNEANCLRIFTMGSNVYARPDHKGGIVLSYNAPNVKGDEEIDAECNIQRKKDDFKVAKSYLLKKYNFETMRFEKLVSMYESGLRVIYATAMKALIEEKGKEKKAC